MLNITNFSTSKTISKVKGNTNLDAWFLIMHVCINFYLEKELNKIAI